MAILAACSSNTGHLPVAGSAGNGGGAGASSAGAADGGNAGRGGASAGTAGADTDAAHPAADGGRDAASTYADSGTTSPSHSRQATQADGLYFPPGAPWSTDVHDATLFPKAADSDAITAWMVAHAGGDGWGSPDTKLQIDFALVAVDVPAGTPKRTFQTGDPSFHADPDCDSVAVPVPQAGLVEGAGGSPLDPQKPWSGYACAGFDNGEDCHMLFVSRDEHRLYELYHATIDASGAFYAGCLALWDTSRVYDLHGRGDQCTSADAAGFPIAPLLFTAEEVKAGVINHAIRFAIPNDMIRQKQYVPPATHGTNTTGPATAMPYGAHLRLKTPYPGMAQLSPAAQVVAKALQTYGMYMADGGRIPLMGQADDLGSVKWAEVGLDSGSLKGIKATDFEVLAYPTPTAVTYACQRTAITQ